MLSLIKGLLLIICYFMRKLIFLIVLISLTSCDDGDLITLSLDFDKSLERCGDENSDSYIIYDVKNDSAFESLIILFDGGESNDLLFNPEEQNYSREITINGTSNRFNYRIYDGDPLNVICQEIPDASVNIIEDNEATSGTIIATSTFVDDDNDGIPSNLEDLNGNGDLEDDDSDGDGIPNYKDEDDDNDNVKTINENPDPDEDGVISDAQDTDGDGTPDYLDIDDDNDGTITRYEDANGNNDPLDDFEVGSILPRYLDILLLDEFVNDNLIENEFDRIVTVSFQVINVNINALNADELDLGTFTINANQ